MSRPLFLCIECRGLSVNRIGIIAVEAHLLHLPGTKCLQLMLELL